jgi:hypothetical protein
LLHQLGVRPHPPGLPPQRPGGDPVACAR